MRVYSFTANVIDTEAALKKLLGKLNRNKKYGNLKLRKRKVSSTQVAAITNCQSVKCKTLRGQYAVSRIKL